MKPEGGMRQVSQRIIDAYDFNYEYELVAGSEFARVATIDGAFANEEWLAFLAWRPTSRLSRTTSTS
jgi:ABC-type proline/glycine betaine transport system substrate-binding protein